MSGEHLIQTRYRVLLPARCPECGASVHSSFDHVDRECGDVPAADPREFEVMWPREPGYDLLKAIIGPLLNGGNLEHVAVLADFDGGSNFSRADMFVDDKGVLKGLPRNEDATVIYRRATLCGRSAAPVPADPDDLPAIAGPAILFSRRVWF